MSKFIVPLSLSNFLVSPGNVFATGFVGAYILDSKMKLFTDGVERDLVLDRTLDQLDAAAPVLPVFAEDTVLEAINKLQNALSSITLTGDVTGTAEYQDGKLVIATTIQGSFVDKHYVHVQTQPSMEWSINHPLGKRPSVTTLNTAKDRIYGDEEYPSDNLVIVRFTQAVNGTAELN